MAEKFVYNFKEGNKDMKEILGGKGANLAEMISIGLPVPGGFTITTESCNDYYKKDKTISSVIIDQIKQNLTELENEMGKKLGDPNDPLLVSVRSGAAASMPGMMDTVLNLGLNDKSVEGLANKTNNFRFAYDAYRRFIQMFGNVVLGVDSSFFEEKLEEIKKDRGVKLDTELNDNDLKKVVESYKHLIEDLTAKTFPEDGFEQLKLSIEAVFGSWNNDRAIIYRRMNHISGLLGTAVNVQSMVYGNMGEDSGTGVCFTRNPSTGENKFYGEFLMNAQGEDVVAGIRTPGEIEELESINLDAYEQLIDIRKKLEDHYKDMQDIEFTIEQGKLYILQTRNGKRTAPAAVRIAVELEKDGILSKEQALQKIEPEALDQLLHKQLNQNSKSSAVVLTKGLPASPGAAVGKISFSAEEAKTRAFNGEKVILVRTETSPEDIEGMNAAEGILTARGGMTSHAAVVARGMGKCCVAGCNEIVVNEENKELDINGEKFGENDCITLDGSSGEVFEGELDLEEPTLSGDFETIMNWSDTFRKLKIRTNADTPKDAETAVQFGAEGIGLCRTEHMFFEGERIKAVREMILSDDIDGRKKALAKLLPMQRTDFHEIFEVMNGRPVTIRLLDPPLHEFLPKDELEIHKIAYELNINEKKLKEKISELHEFNPMLGHRGCRLSISYPEITEMQARAIFEAASLIANKGQTILPEIMIPLVGNVKEFEHQKNVIKSVYELVKEEQGIEFNYLIGTMIEVPRGAITADKIAEQAEFFSFGTNDLTQMGCGFSRDDSSKFINEYIEKGIYERDPFQSIDREGIGEIMKIGVRNGKGTREDLKIGICGEHGGDPKSIEFCHEIGLDYVSCSPFRVPIARLSAAIASIKNK